MWRLLTQMPVLCPMANQTTGDSLRVPAAKEGHLSQADFFGSKVLQRRTTSARKETLTKLHQQLADLHKQQQCDLQDW